MTLGTAPAHISGSQVALFFQVSEAPAALATSARWPPYCKPKPTSADPRPLIVQNTSPFPTEGFPVGPLPSAASRARPALAQTSTPTITSATPPITAIPCEVNAVDVVKSGMSAPTAAEMPRITEKARAIPTASTARPKKTWETPHPAPQPAAMAIGPEPESE